MQKDELMDQEYLGQWQRVCARLQSEFGEAAYNSWLRPLSFKRIDGGLAYLQAPTRFMRDWVLSHYGERIRVFLQAEDSTIKDIDISVESAAGQEVATARDSANDAGLVSTKEISDREAAIRKVEDTGPRFQAGDGVKVLDIEDGRIVFPDPESGRMIHQLLVELPTVDIELFRSLSGRSQIKEQLAIESGDAVARLFYEYEPRILGDRLQAR